MKINVLTNNSCPNSRAFNCPLILTKQIFADKNVDIDLFFRINDKLFKSDILFINSNVFRKHWSKDKDYIFQTLEKAKIYKQKIVWFDTTDSTWCTQFEALPYVDIFMKNQIFSDINQYLVRYKTGRVFTDFFDEIYDAGESEYKYAIPEKEQLWKIAISWAPCFENYNEGRYSLGQKIKNAARPLTANLFKEKLSIDFISPAKKRTQTISARFGLSHPRNSVVAHRKAVKEILEKGQVDCSHISLSDYFSELKNSRISVSPYGVGEFCYRDYEIISCGAVLIKPDMSHLKTWPDLYQNNKTYFAHQWDLSDLENLLNELTDNPESCIDVAENAQSVYKQAISNEGLELFVNRLLVIINKTDHLETNSKIQKN